MSWKSSTFKQFALNSINLAYWRGFTKMDFKMQIMFRLSCAEVRTSLDTGPVILVRSTHPSILWNTNSMPYMCFSSCIWWFNLLALKLHFIFYPVFCFVEHGFSTLDWKSWLVLGKKRVISLPVNVYIVLVLVLTPFMFNYFQRTIVFSFKHWFLCSAIPALNTHKMQINPPPSVVFVTARYAQRHRFWR